MTGYPSTDREPDHDRPTAAARRPVSNRNRRRIRSRLQMRRRPGGAAPVQPPHARCGGDQQPRDGQQGVL
ncbi:hypothetical protein, partial [Planomonospora algeriensis]